MDFWTVLKACARRWYVFLPILGVSLVIGTVQVGNQAPSYSAISSAVLTGPALVPGVNAGETVEVNPFQTLSSSLTTTSQVLVSLMDSEPKRQQFAAEGVGLDYAVSIDGAVVYFDVTGSDPAEVTGTAAHLIDLLDTEVAGLQSMPVDAPESRIRAVALAVPTTADKDTTASLRLMAVIGLIGLVAAAAGAVAVEGAMAVRARRASEHEADAIAATSWTEPARVRREATPNARITARAPSVATVVATISRSEPDADTAIIADGPVTAPAARHGRHD